MNKKLKFKGYEQTEGDTTQFFDWLFDTLLEKQSNKIQLTRANSKHYDDHTSKTLPKGDLL